MYALEKVAQEQENINKKRRAAVCGSFFLYLSGGLHMETLI